MDDPFLKKEETTKVPLYRRPWVLAFLAGICLVTVLAFSINKIMLNLLHSRDEVIVPNLEGKNLNNALGILSGLKLSLRQESTESDETLPAGTILRQHPASGMKVREGRAINVVVSMGGQAVFVPSVVGKPLPEVQSNLAQEKLQVGAVAEIFSLDVAEGLVVSQTPSSGTVVARGAMVDVMVSKGSPPQGLPLVPDFVGKTVDNVQAWASGVNVKVAIIEDSKGVGSAGQVLKQSPLQNQPIAEGELVRVIIVPLVSKNGFRFSYQIPGSKSDIHVRMVARDNKGESEVYKGIHKGGETIEVPMAINETTRVRIFLDDVLQEEKVVEP